MQDAFEELYDILGKYDADFKTSTASLCAWDGQLRLTLKDEPNRPARSVVFFSTGHSDPAGVAASVVADFKEWKASTGTEPLPIPSWQLERYG